MATRSTEKRPENRHRFKTFSERLSEVNIDVVHRISRVRDTQDIDTHFGEGVQKWKELNCTQHFTQFHKEVCQKCSNYTQVVHHEAVLVASLKTHLQVPDSLALQPLLDLVVQLARDLQADFYPHFGEFFRLLVPLLNTQDTELIEWTFTCLLYLFKFLWRHLVRDITQVYSLYCPLLGKDHKPHIKNFAAESFAFLMRKVRDPSDFFDFIFRDLEENPDRSSGVGRLLFEMLKGVQKQFHSCTGKVFPIMLSKLGPADVSQEDAGKAALPWQQVQEALQDTLQSMAEFTSRGHAGVIWDALITASTEVHSRWQEDQTESRLADHQDRILRLVLVWVRHKQGDLITDPDKLWGLLVQLLSDGPYPGESGTTLLELTSDLLLSEKCSLDVAQISKLVTLVQNSGYSSQQVFYFFRRVFVMNMFEKDVLPAFLQYCTCVCEAGETGEADTGEAGETGVLQVLTQLVLLKRPPPDTGAALPAWDRYPLHFKEQNKKSRRKGQSSASHQPRPVQLILSQLEMVPDQGSMWRLWGALIGLPHVRISDKDQLFELLQSLTHKLHGEAKSSSQSEKWLYLLSLAVFVLLRHCPPEQGLTPELSNLLLELLRTYPSSPSVLWAADIFFTTARQQETSGQELLKGNVLQDVFPHLQSNLSNPAGKVRLLTLRVLSNFKVELPDLEPGEEEFQDARESVFKTCLQAEETPASVQLYREKLMYLNRLDFDTVRRCVPKGPYQQVALRCLIGQLYVNMKLLWKPVTDLIKSHACGMDVKEFWSVWREHLKQAAEQAEQDLYKPRKGDSPSDQPETEDSPEDFFEETFQDVVSNRSTPDHTNFRHLLWTAMAEFPDKCEPKSRDLSPLLFQFFDNEYYPADLAAAPAQDIRKPQENKTDDVIEIDQSGTEDSNLNIKSDQSEDKDDDDAEEEEEDDITHEDVSTADKVSRTRRKAASRSLVVHLTLFSKFKSPRSLYLEPRLKELYFEMLKHREQDVQRAALACLMTYKAPYLTPYSDNLDRLLQDKEFREELTLFSIDQDNSVVQQEHREGLLPVLFRLLYGRMQQKTGEGTQGRQGARVRTALVLRFLGGCTPEELETFLEMILAPFAHLMNTDVSCVELVQQEATSLDLSAVIPLSKQQGSLATVQVLLNKMGNLLQGYIPRVFRLLVAMVTSHTRILDSRHLVKKNLLQLVKKVRTLAMRRLLELFQQHDQYSFSRDEIEALFTGVVWPQLDQQRSEVIHQPTPLLRLVHLWSKNLRYHPLLAKSRPDQPDRNLIDDIITTFFTPTSAPPVVAMVMEVVGHLLLESESEEAVDVEPLEVPGCTILLGETSRKDSEAPIGTRLLLPHVAAILGHLRSAVQSIGAAGGRQNRPKLPLSELNILSRISAYVKDPRQSAVLVGLLLPYLRRPAITDHSAQVDILVTVGNLVKQVPDPKACWEQLAAMLSSLEGREPRGELCKVFAAVAERDLSVREISTIIHDLNTWDRKRVEEPDYDTRLSAFKSVNQAMQDWVTIDMTFALPIIHNCFHIVLRIEDFSLRSNASYCVTQVLQKMEATSSTQEEYKKVVQGTILPLVRKGLWSRNESVHQESVSLLAAIVKTFSSRQYFQGLAQLTDEDVEKDFYQNITHIQHHRRSRALRRLITVCNTGAINPSILQSFILPVTSFILNDPKLVKVDFLQHEAVQAVGAMAGCLPWKGFLSLLLYYLNKLTEKLEGQKTNIKLIVAVMDAFHFDLSVLSATSEDAEDASQEDEDILQEAEETPEEEEDVEEESEETVEEEEEEEDAVVMETGEDKEKAEAELIFQTLTNVVLPKLHKGLTQKVKSEEAHKKARLHADSEEELLRVPIALATVKLLQKLPGKVLRNNLQGVLLKVCSLLKSRSEDIRETSRNTLVKILESLGPTFFPQILRDLRHCLTKGYQVHVLTYTTHALLKSMEERLEPGGLDRCLDSLVEVFNEELFGKLSEEKEVEGITSKLKEAKSSKSSDSYETLAKVVGKTSLARLVLPLKEVLDSTQNLKTSRKVQDVLAKIVSGLMKNPGLTPDAMLIFAHGLVTESLPLITAQVKAKLSAAPPPDPRLRPESCLILPPTPQRAGSKTHISIKTNKHILVEFGLQLLHHCMKRGHLSAGEVLHLQMLDPFVAQLYDCLRSKHVKIITVAMRCLTWFLRFPLPSLKQKVSKVAAEMFVILKKYGGAGGAKGENFDLVVTCFKALTVLVRDVKYYNVDQDQLRVLLQYAEQDILDYTRQATAFTLLKAILSRKLVVPEMHDVMGRIAELSIKSELDNVRVQCRQVFSKFLIDYPLGKKLHRHLEFFVRQLNYDLEAGRESALEMIATIFSSFPQNLLEEYAAFFFVPLSSRLINDDSAKCRKLTALAIKSLLGKVGIPARDNLFIITMQWFQDDNKILHQRLAAQLCSLFVEVEKLQFERRLPEVLPQMLEVIDPDRYEATSAEEMTQQLRQEDHLLYSALSCLVKVLQECAIVIRGVEHRKDLNTVWASLQHHLLHPHAWVRLASAQLFGCLFAAWKPEELVTMATDGDNQTPKKKKRKVEEEDNIVEYLRENTMQKLRDLSADFCTQLQSSYLDHDLANQVIKNLVFLAKVVRQVTPDTAQTDDVTDGNGDVTTQTDDVDEPSSKSSDRKRTKPASDGKKDNRTGHVAGNTGIDDVRATGGDESTLTDDRRVTVSLIWLLRRMNRLAKFEAATAPKETIKRSSVIKFLAAVAMDLGAAGIGPYLTFLMTPVLREVNNATPQADPELKKLSQDVLELLKTQAGVQLFSQVYSQVQHTGVARREARKRRQAVEAVADPKAHAKKKIAKNLAKQRAKKRKIEEKRPTKKKKIRLADLAILQ
ncbi:small subunit processome component 20 homolog isoform X3 [Branchiostoma floridae x Branchiostoma japonicum]